MVVIIFMSGLRIHVLAATEIQRAYRGYLDRKKINRRKQWESTKPGPERIKVIIRIRKILIIRILREFKISDPSILHLYSSNLNYRVNMSSFVAWAAVYRGEQAGFRKTARRDRRSSQVVTAPLFELG